MGIIEDANSISIEGRGKFCTLWLDEYPKEPVYHKISVDGEVFDLVMAHYNFGAGPIRKYFCIDLSNHDMPDEWFVGKEVLPAD